VTPARGIPGRHRQRRRPMEGHRTFRLGWWRGHDRRRLHGVASKPLLSDRGRQREGASVTDSLVGLPGRTGGRVRALIIGCGNLLRGDDGVGPEVVRRLTARGLPDGVGCIDAATAGIDVALWMRSVPLVIVVDACCSGSAPGTLIELRGAELEHLPPPSVSASMPSAGIMPSPSHAGVWPRSIRPR